MSDDVLIVHGPTPPLQPLVLDSPHSGFLMPADFGSVCTEAELRDGEDCFIDELWLPATARGVPLLAAQFPRTYLDPNRHAGDIDLDLLDAPWPDEWVPSGKSKIGKSLVWRTLDDGRPIYARQLTVAELQQRVARYHQPYHQALQQLMQSAHERFGQVFHINCHSMNAVSGATCAPAFTAFVRGFLQRCGYDVKVNDPFKGVELVRAYSQPAAGRHSLQLEVNKRLYMDAATLQKHAGFDRLQGHLMQLVDAILEHFGNKAPA
jgi:N-formylglutamate amidohydrolase